MIQRKQTIYLLLAVIAMLVCLFNPIMRLTSERMGADSTVYNLWTVNAADGGYSLSVIPLFCTLVLTTVIAILTIFMDKNRKQQMRLCTLSILLMVVWVALYAVYGFIIYAPVGAFHATIYACLPVVAAILFFMARQGIKADERLVRAADRIR